MARKATNIGKYLVMTGDGGDYFEVCSCGKLHKTLTAAKADAEQHVTDGGTARVLEVVAEGEAVASIDWE